MKTEAATTLNCDGCRQVIRIPEPTGLDLRVAISFMREDVGRFEGRSTWRYGGALVHQCAEGAYGRGGAPTDDHQATLSLRSR